MIQNRLISFGGESDIGWSVFWGNNWLSQQNNGRSGYWRLFYTQLQEQALEKDKEQKEKEKDVPVVEVIEESAPTIKKVKKQKKAVVKEPPPPEVHERPLLPEPYSVEQPDVTPFLRIVSNEFRAWMFSSLEIQAIMFQREKSRKLEEEEEAAELLYLIV